MTGATITRQTPDESCPGADSGTGSETGPDTGPGVVDLADSRARRASGPPATFPQGGDAILPRPAAGAPADRRGSVGSGEPVVAADFGKPAFPVEAVVDLDTRIARVPGEPGLFHVEIAATAEDTAGRWPSIEIGRLHAYRVIEPRLAGMMTTGFRDIAASFEAISHDALCCLGGLENARTALAVMMGGHIDRLRPASLVFVEQVSVHPRMRGEKLGLRLLGALLEAVAGGPSLAILDAFAFIADYETRPGDASFASSGEDLASVADARATGALSRYYRSDPALGFCRPQPRERPSFHAALWTGALTDPDGILPKVTLPSTLHEAAARR